MEVQTMFHTSKRMFLTISLVLMGIVSCSSEQEKQRVTTAKTGTNVVIVLGHEVNDYEVWKQSFENRQALRDEFGVSVSSILHGEDTPQLVWIMATAPSKEAAETFLEDVGTARTMESDGVVGEVYRAILDKGYSSSVDGAAYPERIIVQHAVKDFAKWKSVFDGHIGSRERMGVVDIFVSHPVDDSTDVHMMFGVTDAEKVMDYMTSDALRIAMKLSGVVGEPKAYFVRVAE